MPKTTPGLDLVVLLFDSTAENVQKFNHKNAESKPAFIYGGGNE